MRAGTHAMKAQLLAQAAKGDDLLWRYFNINQVCDTHRERT